MELGAGPELPQRPPPGPEGSARLPLQAALALLADHGWCLLLGLVAVALLVRRLGRRLPSLRPAPAAAAEPDAVVRQQEALLAARLRMQETLNAQAEKFKEKQRKLEEEKRRQKIAMWECMQEGKSYKESLQQNQKPEPSTSTAAPKPKSNRKPLRGDGYNPLSGEGGGTCSWRPGRRGPSSGG